MARAQCRGRSKIHKPERSVPEGVAFSGKKCPACCVAERAMPAAGNRRRTRGVYWGAGVAVPP